MPRYDYYCKECRQYEEKTFAVGAAVNAEQYATVI